MAVSRVGGTKGLISGSVGDNTYLIVKNPSGVYTQVVQQKKTTHANTKTERLAVQQMCTAIVEAMMRDIKPIIKYSFQSARNVTSSVNTFSQFALLALSQDCKANWFQSGDFYYPDKGTHTPVAGPFTLSSGSLPYNAFQSVQSVVDYVNALPVEQKPSALLFMNGVAAILSPRPSDKTIGDFMYSNRLTYTSQIFVACFTERIDSDKEKVYNQYHYAVVSVNPRVLRDAPISVDTLSSLFSVKSSDEFGLMVNPINLDVVAGAFWYDRLLETDVVSVGGFTRDLYMGKWLVRSSKFVPATGRSWPYYSNAMPAVQLWSWMGGKPSQIYDYPW